MESRLVLAIDNSIDFLNIALCLENTLVEERRVKSTVPPSQVIAGHVEGMLSGHGYAGKDLAALAATLGPGSFTGMRVALAFAKGLSAGLGIPLIGISTLDVLAAPFAFMEDRYIMPIIDAKKGEVFTALYRATGGAMERLTSYKSVKPTEIDDIVKTPCLAFGTGVRLCEETLLAIGDVKIIKDSFFSVSAGELAKEAFRRFDDAEARSAKLIYGRRSEAEIKFNVTVT